MKKKIFINSCWTTAEVGWPHWRATKADNAFRRQISLSHEIKKHTKDIGPMSVIPDTKQSHSGPHILCPYSILCFSELTWRAVFSSMDVVSVDKLKSSLLYDLSSYCFPSFPSSPLWFNFGNDSEKNFLKYKKIRNFPFLISCHFLRIAF